MWKEKDKFKQYKKTLQRIAFDWTDTLLQSKNIHIKNLKDKKGPMYKLAEVSFKLGSKRPCFTGITAGIYRQKRVKNANLRSRIAKNRKKSQIRDEISRGSLWAVCCVSTARCTLGPQLTASKSKNCLRIHKRLNPIMYIWWPKYPVYYSDDCPFRRGPHKLGWILKLLGAG